MAGPVDIEALKTELLSAVDAAGSEAALEALRVEALGKKGQISLMMRSLGQMSPEERQTMGPALNGLKDRIGDAIAAKKAALEDAALDARLATERADVTLPVRPEPRGKLHPVTQVMEELAVIFSDMGFTVAEGPDVEDDFHNFTALNFPEGHPARDTHDTFFMKPRGDGSQMVLRTHTSPVQIRTMKAASQNGGEPVRIIAPGRVYRSDSDATHTPMFHQVEGLVIDRQAHMGHLKGILMDFLAAFFETDTVEAHRMDPERYAVPQETADAIAACRARGGRVVAVGSTSVRTLETVAAAHGGQVVATSGSSSIFIYPPYRFQVADAMLTNFHLPQSTLIMMIAAMVGRERILDAYREAVRERYRFFSYGDCMLIV